MYSFGFMPGYQVAARTAPHVPLSQRNNALYPYTHMEHNPLAEILLRHARPDAPMAMKDVECAVFEHGTVVVNHRPTPVTLPDAAAVQGQQAIRDGILPSHSAAVLWEENV